MSHTFCSRKRRSADARCSQPRPMIQTQSIARAERRPRRATSPPTRSSCFGSLARRSCDDRRSSFEPVLNLRQISRAKSRFRASRAIAHPARGRALRPARSRARTTRDRSRSAISRHRSRSCRRVSPSPRMLSSSFPTEAPRFKDAAVVAKITTRAHARALSDEEDSSLETRSRSDPSTERCSSCAPPGAARLTGSPDRRAFTPRLRDRVLRSSRARRSKSGVGPSSGSTTKMSTQGTERRPSFSVSSSMEGRRRCGLGMDARCLQHDQN